MSHKRPSLLIVEDDSQLAEQLRWALKKDYRVDVAGCRESAIRALNKIRPDLVILDLCLPPGNVPDEGFRVLEKARSKGFTAVVMSALDEREPALKAIERGAYDFFSKPFDVKTLRIVINRALERRALERENSELRKKLQRTSGLTGIVGTSAAMGEVYDAVRRVADSPLTVTIRGESGTGKGLVARAIHDSGARRDHPFVAVHCASLPETLLEAELFGHEKGAFTGASQARIGRFESASGGTLFLDEIGCLDQTMQIKLLRVLEERSVEKLGGNRVTPVDIRLIVATNENLENKVQSGELREDFYFRIMVFPIHLPALRERIEDAPLLAEHFLRRVGENQGLPAKRLTEEARMALVSRQWPGNVRELRNLIETMALVVDGDAIDIKDIERLPCQITNAGGTTAVNGEGFKAAVEAYERRILTEAIRTAKGVKAQAARALRLDPSQMKYLVRKHNL